MSEAGEALVRLQALLSGLEAPHVAIAVSGGIDSLPLSAAAAPVLRDRLALHHASSPAVPGEATERTRALAERLGVRLEVFDAGEFDAARYRANPANRCLFCKNSLYGAIASRLRGSGTLVLSGTNTDDLADYRPGLQAADAHGVRHPFVEAGISKATLRGIAARLGLGALSELPSAPCLSSRIETGLFIEPRTLALVHEAERLVVARLEAASPGKAQVGEAQVGAAQVGAAAGGIRTVRCRVRRDGLVIELDPASLRAVQEAGEDALGRTVAALAAQAGEPARPVRFAAYRTGSAFLRPAAAAQAARS